MCAIVRPAVLLFTFAMAMGTAVRPAPAQLLTDLRSGVSAAAPVPPEESPVARTRSEVRSPANADALGRAERTSEVPLVPPPPHQGRHPSREWFVAVGAGAGMLGGIVWAVQANKNCGFPGACVMLVPVGMLGGAVIGGAAGFVVWAATRPFARPE